MGKKLGTVLGGTGLTISGLTLLVPEVSHFFSSDEEFMTYEGITAWGGAIFTAQGLLYFFTEKEQKPKDRIVNGLLAAGVLTTAGVMDHFGNEPEDFVTQREYDHFNRVINGMAGAAAGYTMVALTPNIDVSYSKSNKS